MTDDIGTIHVPVPAGLTPAQVDELFDRVVDTFRDYDADAVVSMHLDGPCETSAHCFRAYLRKLTIIAPPKRSLLRGRW